MKTKTKTPPVKVNRNSISKAIDALLTLPTVRQAVVFQHPRLTIVATRSRRPDRRSKLAEIVLTIGRPNYLNRERIATLQRAGQPFPVKRVHLSHYPA